MSLTLTTYAYEHTCLAKCRLFLAIPAALACTSEGLKPHGVMCYYSNSSFKGEPDSLWTCS